MSKSNMEPIVTSSKEDHSNSKKTIGVDLRLPDSLVQGCLVEEHELLSLLDELSHLGRRPDEL